MTLVRLFEEYLGCHVGSSSQVCLEVTATITSLHWSRESEVCNFQVVVRVKHDIFRLKVSVRYALGVNVVHHLQHLFEVVATDRLGEGTECNEIEQLPALHKFKNHIGHSNLSTVGLDPFGVVLVLKQSHHVLVVQAGIDSNFLLQSFECGGRIARV